MSGGGVSGVDLARVALRAALEAARKNGGRTAKAKPRPTSLVVRHGGREPLGLDAAMTAPGGGHLNLYPGPPNVACDLSLMRLWSRCRASTRRSRESPWPSACAR